MTTKKQRLDAVQATHGIWKDLPRIQKPDEAKAALLLHLTQHMPLGHIEEAMKLAEDYANACIAEEEGWI